MIISARALRDYIEKSESDISLVTVCDIDGKPLERLIRKLPLRIHGGISAPSKARIPSYII